MDLKEIESLDNDTKTKLIERLLETISNFVELSKEQILNFELKELKKV